MAIPRLYEEQRAQIPALLARGLRAYEFKGDVWTTKRIVAVIHRTFTKVDESGFYLLPGVVRTYAPRGQTPIPRAPLIHDHLSAISRLASRAMAGENGATLSRSHVGGSDPDK